MKKLLTFSILTYLLFTINSSAANQDSNKNNSENENVLKIGVLLPLSGEFQTIGQSFLKAIRLALRDISNENIIIYPKDSKANSMDAYKSAKEFKNITTKANKENARINFLIIFVLDILSPKKPNILLIISFIIAKGRTVSKFFKLCSIIP